MSSIKGAPPNPNWKPGDGLTRPSDTFKEFDFATLDAVSIYRLMIGAVVPRPIAFVTTLSERGEINAAPFSFFTAVSSAPPCLVFSVAAKPKGAGNKDTLRNIEATREFVVNFATESLAEPLNHCATSFDYGVDELKMSGLTPLPSTLVRVPRIAESPLHLECRLENTLAVGDSPKAEGSATLVVGRILKLHVIPEAWDGKDLILEKLLPLSRLGGHDYGRTREIFSLARNRK